MKACGMIGLSIYIVCSIICWTVWDHPVSITSDSLAQKSLAPPGHWNSWDQPKVTKQACYSRLTKYRDTLWWLFCLFLTCTSSEGHLLILFWRNVPTKNATSSWAWEPLRSCHKRGCFKFTHVQLLMASRICSDIQYAVIHQNQEFPSLHVMLLYRKTSNGNMSKIIRRPNSKKKQLWFFLTIFLTDKRSISEEEIWW